MHRNFLRSWANYAFRWSGKCIYPYPLQFFTSTYDVLIKDFGLKGASKHLYSNKIIVSTYHRVITANSLTILLSKLPISKNLWCSCNKWPLLELYQQVYNAPVIVFSKLSIQKSIIFCCFMQQLHLRNDSVINVYRYFGIKAVCS